VSPNGSADAGLLSAEPDRAGALRRSFRFVRPHRTLVLAAVVTSALATLAELGGPVLVGEAVDAVLSGDEQRLLATVGAYAAVIVLLLVLQRARRILAARASEGFLIDLRMTVVEKLLARPMAFFDRHSTGQLVARATSDVSALSGFVREGLQSLVDSVLLLAVTMLVLFFESWELALVTLLYLPGLGMAVHRYRRSSGPAYARFAEAEAATTAAIGETLAARPLLQGVGAAGPWSRRVEATDRKLLESNDEALRADNTLSVLGFWQQLTLAAVVVAGGLLVGRGALSVGGVVTFALALRQLFAPLDALSWQYAEAQRARALLARILELISGPDLPVETTAESSFEGGLELRATGVDYAYEPGRPVLKGVDLSVAAGERVALVGATGCGKSTLAKIVCGLLTPDAGEVLVGGRPLQDWDPVALRRAVVLLPQEGHIFEGTLAENLRLVPGEHTCAELTAAMEKAGLGRWLDRLEGGLEAPLADRGANLSAGERQLVSMGRVALADPAVLLLDEATADVDPTTEALVVSALERLTAKRTVLVVAHRSETAARCDRVVSLDSADDGQNSLDPKN
jgi:ATP-binding cassette, subfamily B, bacterial